ncbi:hypothetical protein M8C21_004067, partial [Ambrosia artemisiifolia]
RREVNIADKGLLYLCNEKVFELYLSYYFYPDATQFVVKQVQNTPAIEDEAPLQAKRIERERDAEEGGRENRRKKRKKPAMVLSGRPSVLSGDSDGSSGTFFTVADVQGHLAPSSTDSAKALKASSGQQKEKLFNTANSSTSFADPEQLIEEIFKKASAIVVAEMVAVVATYTDSTPFS